MAAVVPTTALSRLGKVQETGVLVLEDGSRFEGVSFGASTSVTGEAVFQTGMVGYPESLTDPSYTGQILVLTVPMVGNYGVPPDVKDEYGIPKFFESDKIQIAALIVQDYSFDKSHWNAARSLSEWLKANNVPALYGIDTRLLTKKIREKGAMLGKIVFGKNEPEFHDPNKDNLVAKVSTKAAKKYSPLQSVPAGRPPRIIAIDCGMKYNQVRSFLKRGAELTVVPWDYDFTKEPFDGLFISNGPGDPTICTPTIAHIRKAMELGKPVFGICLGNQLLSLSAGAKVYKLKYGNRGHNQPCTNVKTGHCYITMQNHGFAVDNASLPTDWEPYFINANDNTAEGVRHKSKPFFSVQFHPEAKGGPRDTDFLFDQFLQIVRGEMSWPPPEKLVVRHRVNVSKVLILGSGGLSIGQAGEFDYSGSQAIKALREEKVHTVVINPNIATVQTSAGLADKVYFLPVTPEFVTKVIENERPDGILCTFGGQTALNCAVKLYKDGVFKQYGVQVLGTPIDAIIATEDREIFADKLKEIGERIAPSIAARSTEAALAAADKIGYPVIVRAAFTLGGLGSGFANNSAELASLCQTAFSGADQVLVERSMKGWKEVEYEVVRDAYDNCITVCNMENFDPLGIHTGDSIVVAPSMTLTDQEYHMLREVAIRTVRHLGIVGECNIQYALNPDSEEYCVIEVNARLSRSSALASKATGYPLAFVAAKLSLGIGLTEFPNSVTKAGTACFEPSLDYVVVKIPRWDLKKFNRVSKKIGSSMKSVGEVMAIGRTFEEAMQKAIRMVDYQLEGLTPDKVTPSEEELTNPSDERALNIVACFKAGYTVDRIHELTKIDKWFLCRLKYVVDVHVALEKHSAESLPTELLQEAKRLGFSDKQIAHCIASTELAVRNLRKHRKVIPFVKQIDTVAAEFPAQTNYLYMTYHGSEHDVQFQDKGIIVLGSGVYRIGSSVEFDWCAVHCNRTLRKLGYNSIMINYNPETVSTDYDECDRLYFEELSLERVMDVYELEESSGIVVSMGGQIPNNLAMPLRKQNCKILGTAPEMIDNAENRYKFSRMLDEHKIDQPQWKELTSIADAKLFSERVGFPVLVRPSYVLSGAAMNVAYSDVDLENFLSEAVQVSRDHPVVISKFILEAKEIEFDAVARNGEVIMHCISEHVENAGVHSGDATLLFPPQDLDAETVRKVEETSRMIANALNVTGPFNIQYIAKNNEIKVIECNVRASRSFPFVSKTMNVNMIEMATRAILGVPVTTYPIDVRTLDYVGIKVPQFSFTRLTGADPVLGVEMASTGEVACFGKDKYEGYLKGLISTGFALPKRNVFISIGPYKEKMEFLQSAHWLQEMGFKLFASPGTADFFSEHDVPCEIISSELSEGAKAGGNGKEGADADGIGDLLQKHNIELVINLPSRNLFRRPASFMSKGYMTRRKAVDFSLPLLTNIKCAKLFIEAMYRLQVHKRGATGAMPIERWDYRSRNRVVRMPGLIDVHVHFREPGATHKEDWDTGSASALAGGFTMVCAMPNTNPPLTDPASFELCKQLAAAKARCDYAVYLGAGPANAQLIAPLAPVSAGLKMYLDSTFGELRLDDQRLWMSHFEAWPKNVPIVAHSEGRTMSAFILLAALYDRAVHIAHVSTAEEITIIKAAKARGIRVTCEVAPHHLFFISDEIPSFSCGCAGRGEVRPVLAKASDRDALWEHMDVIDMFATDHAPHTLTEKDGAKPPPGFPGLETCLPLLLTAVSEGRLTMEQLVQKMYVNPRKIFRLPEQKDTFIEVDLDEEWTIPSAPAFSKCGWTPFAGRRVKGKVRRVVLRGALAYLDGKVLVQPGYGRDVRETPAAPAVRAQIPDAAALAPESPAHAPHPRAARAAAAPAAVEIAVLEDKAARMGEAASRAGPSSLAEFAMRSLEPRPLSPVGETSGAAAAMAAAADAPSAIMMKKKRGSLAMGRDAHPPVAPVPSTPGTSSLPPPEDGPSLFARDILSVSQFSKQDLTYIFKVASEFRKRLMRQEVIEVCKGTVLCNLFFEPSTRTSCSFQAAMQRLGGTVLSLTDMKSTSVSKGETLEDTVRVVDTYADVVAIRHPEKGAAALAAQAAIHPVINAGDGVGEHPTQALLDLYTMREELGTVNGLTVTMVGDLKNGRTVHSLARLLATHYDVRLQYVSPDSLRMPPEIIADVANRGRRQTQHQSLDAVLHDTDVLYVTRVQKERFANPAEYEAVAHAYCITPHTLTSCKENMIVMHPLPRVGEISPEVDSDPRAAYFRQMEYGLYVRMALLAIVLGRA